MSLFRKAGKKFEQTKREFLGDAAYVCESCTEPVATDHEYCPHCGEPTIEPTDAQPDG